MTGRTRKFLMDGGEMENVEEKTVTIPIKPEDTELRGYWIDLGSAMTPDATWERIRRLTGKYLELIATGGDGRDQLYRDPADGRFWELTPANPQIPAGPPILRVIPASLAEEKYAVRLS
jgi:hypothetical protein